MESSSRSARNTRGNSLTCKEAWSRAKRVFLPSSWVSADRIGPVQHLYGAPSLCGAGSITCFWNINGILIHINVAVQRSAEMAASWGHEWFFGEVIRKGQSRNAAEMAV